MPKLAVWGYLDNDQTDINPVGVSVNVCTADAFCCWIYDFPFSASIVLYLGSGIPPESLSSNDPSYLLGGLYSLHSADKSKRLHCQQFQL